MSARLRRTFRGAGSFVAFVIGFALVAAALTASVPVIRVGHLSQKLDWLAEHPGDHDILVIGSSRMRQVVPTVLDAELGKAGIAARSFNLSADGMRPPEDANVLDRALATRKAPLKFIVMEANPVTLKISEEDEGVARMIHWHDTTRILALWRRAFAHSVEKPPWLGKWISDTWRQMRFAFSHTRYWIWNSVRLGQGSEWLHQRLGLAPTKKYEIGLGPLNDGYIAPNPDPMTADEVKTYRRSLEKKLKLGSDLDPLDTASQRQIVIAAEIAKRHGARLVIVAPPAVVVQSFEPILPNGYDTVFIDLSDPAKFPELFDIKLRRDGSHLTAEGNILFTQILAKHLAAAVGKTEKAAGGER